MTYIVVVLLTFAYHIIKSNTIPVFQNNLQDCCTGQINKKEIKEVTNKQLNMYEIFVQFVTMDVNCWLLDSQYRHALTLLS